VLLNPCRRFSIWIRPSICHSAHLNSLSDLDLEHLYFTPDPFHPSPPLQWYSDARIGAPQSPLRPRFRPPLSGSRLFTSLPFRRCSAWMAALLDRHSSTPVGPLSPGFAPLNYIPYSSINISTHLAHPALHTRHSSFPGGTSFFPPNSSFCLSNPDLIHCEQTSEFEPFKYHQSIQTTLEFNFTHSPGPNHSGIQGAPPASSHRG